MIKTGLTILLLVAAVFIIAGCSLFRDPNVYEAIVYSFDAPDTIRARTTVGVTAHLSLSANGGVVLDHLRFTRSRTQVELRVWARDISNGNDVVTQPVEQDTTFDVRPTGTGPFRLFAPNPDWKPIEKIITVLP